MNQRCHILFLSLLTSVLALPSELFAEDDELTSRQLRERLSFDRSPLESSGTIVTSYASAIDSVRAAVVSIYTSTDIDFSGDEDYQSSPWYRFFGRPPNGEFKQRGLGSGVILTEDGYILTNNHVVGEADDIRVRLPMQQREFDATLVGGDPQTDVALIKIDSEDLPTAKLADSDNLRVGDVVLAIGTPFNLEQSVTMGIVSALGRTESDAFGGRDRFYANFIQTDAPINPGNSGGALIDAKGRLVGINTAIQSGGMGMVQGNIGIGFAIPVNMSLNIVERLLEGDGKVERGYLGVLLRRMDSDLAEALGRDDYSGALVAEVVPGSPAAKAGIEVYDVIVGFEGVKVVNSEKLQFDIGNTPAGRQVEFVVDRDGELVEVSAKLGDRARGLAAANMTIETPAKSRKPSKSEAFLPGTEIRNLETSDRESLGVPDNIEGVLVTRVDGSSLAADAGVEEGDVIVEVDRKPVSDADQANRIRKGFDEKVIMLKIFNGERNSLITVRVD